jgi:hypothetical protein
MWPFDSSDDPNSDSAGTLTEAFANPWISIPSAIGMGLVGAAAPNRGTGHLVKGIQGGLELGLGAEKGAYDRKKKARLDQSLNLAVNGVPSTVYAPDTSPGNEPMTQPRLDAALKAIPTIGGMEPGMTKSSIQALIAGGHGDKAAEALLAHGLSPKQPHTFGGAESGYYTLDANGAPRELVKGLGVKNEWQPYTTDLGDKIETGVINKNTNQRVVQSTQPKGAAPARTLTPEDINLKKAQAASANASAQRQAAIAKRAAELAKTPGGSVAYKEFVALGGDAQDEEGFLDYATRKAKATRKPSVIEQLGGGGPATTPGKTTQTPTAKSVLEKFGIQ